MSDIVLVILAIVTLGYLGLGVQPPTPDWGRMIAGRAALPDHELGAGDHPGPRGRPDRPRAVAASPTASPTSCDRNDRHRSSTSATCAWSSPLARGLVRAVDGASFELRRGEALGLVGESGSGKTMALRALVGVFPRQARLAAGEILFEGADLHLAPRQRTCACGAVARSR